MNADLFSHIARTLLDFVFPPSEDECVVRSLSPHELISLMTHRNTDDMHVLLPYTERRARACIHETKFHHNKIATELLGVVLYEYLQTLPEGVYLLVPIPISAARFRERGYNQVTEVAKAALSHPRMEHPVGIKPLHITLREDILRRTRDTIPQTDLPKEKRPANIIDAFAVRKSDSVEGAHVLLLDDVLTTGATMHEAREALKKLKPASITCLALAH